MPQHPATDRLALFAMLALFPGSFFYQLSVGLGLIPAFAGGYFGLACASIFVLLGVRYGFRTLGKLKVQPFDTAYLGFLLYFAGVAALNSLTKHDDEHLTWHLTAVIQCATVYLIFKGMTGRSKAARRFIWLAVSGMTACIFYFMENGVFSIRAISGNTENISSYQGFALYYLICSIIAIKNIQTRTLRIISYPAVTYALYVNGARSEFVALLIFIVTFEICRSNFKSLSATSAMILLLAISATLYSGAVNLPENRVTRLLNLSEDNSSLVRNQISEQGFSRILDNPLLGDYGSYEKGYYIHNILSVWLDLGLLGFIYFLMLILIPLVLIGGKITLKGKSDAEHAFIFSSLVACLVLLIFGKYFTYLMLPAVLGYYSSALQQITANPNNSVSRVKSDKLIGRDGKHPD
ncbi:O-antigen ligase domain-containing protein [Pseudomonas sp. R1-6]|uniref:O-antigen ligase domain-containing protein n=1 Tax=Pseudomonas sp. R1-6 TaxID=2817397 RepID=UPI003DA8FB1A